MIFEWDYSKDILNRRKHGISFDEARRVFDDKNALSILDEEHSSIDEERWITIGNINSMNIILVVHLIKDINSVEHIRIISARKATKIETKQYFINQENIL